MVLGLLLFPANIRATWNDHHSRLLQKNITCCEKYYISRKIQQHSAHLWHLPGLLFPSLHAWPTPILHFASTQTSVLQGTLSLLLTLTLMVACVSPSRYLHTCNYLFNLHERWVWLVFICISWALHSTWYIEGPQSQYLLNWIAISVSFTCFYLWLSHYTVIYSFFMSVYFLSHQIPSKKS